jgi:hypothetical protein
MDQLTDKEYRERNAMTPIGNQCFSYLTKEEIKELRHAVLCAYPTMSAQDRKRKVHTMACQPTQAALFVDRVN